MPLMKKNLFTQRRLLAGLLLFACVLVSAPRINAQAATAAAAIQEKPASYAAARNHARSIAKEWLSRGIPGFSVTVARDGKIVYSEGFGYADLEEKAAAWPTTKFRIGSISKPLTAVALVKLAEQGKLDLDAPIQK